MKTSKEAFEAYCWERGFNPEVYPAVTEWQRVWQAATEARDAHWREKLQSEEVVKNVGRAISRAYADHGDTSDIANAALAAISKEVTK